jgi:hypothetical protein
LPSPDNTIAAQARLDSFERHGQNRIAMLRIAFTIVACCD